MEILGVGGVKIVHVLLFESGMESFSLQSDNRRTVTVAHMERVCNIVGHGEAPWAGTKKQNRCARCFERTCRQIEGCGLVSVLVSLQIPTKRGLDLRN